MAVITVNSSTAFASALSGAHAGDTIQLAAGTYSGLAFKDLTFAQDVTITSADPLHQAVLTNFNVTNVTGLTVSNVQMMTIGGVNAFDFIVKNSHDVHFDHVSVHGTLNGNVSDDANGISFAGSTDVSVTNSTFQQLGRAMAVSTSSNVTISGNTVHDMRSDGFDFAQVDHVTISGNNLSNFHPNATDHPDAIQFWTSGTTAPSHDITVSGNVIAIGNGSNSQGIFFRDQLGNMPYSNVKISDNLIDGTGYNGIRIGHVNGITLTDNQLTTNPGSNVETYFAVTNSDHVVSTNNSAISIGFSGSTNVVETGDTIVHASSDYGNANLAAWLHAHGMDSLYASLSNSGTNGSTDAHTATTASGTTTTSAPAVVTTAPVAPPPVTTTTTTTTTAPVTAVAPTHAATTAASDQTLNATTKTLTLTGDADNAGTGNALDNVITGNIGDNHLYGMAGNDTLDGGTGGADTLTGGTGNDTYILPNSSDVIVEKAGEGIDTVIAKGNYVLGDNVENLTINNTVTNGWSGTGNTLNNVITGNGGANAIDGAAGNDTIDGAAGNDNIIGGAGDDRLTGGAGADMFRFAVHSGHDVITDFGFGPDKDTVDISAYKQAGYTASLHDVGADVVISFTTGDSITLLGVHASQLTATSTGWVF